MSTDTGTEAERAAYAELLAASPQRSVFAEAWWLDAATGRPEGWQPNLLRSDRGVVRAAWPMPVRRERAGTVAVGAPYTPFLGPLLAGSDRTGVARISAEVDALEHLAASIAELAHVEAACMPELDYWTPLAWYGFTQTTRTTWRLPARATTLDKVRAGMRKGHRSTLVATERDGLVVGDGDVSDLLRACQATFAAQGAGVPAAAVLERLARQAVERGRGEILAVRTPDGALASAGLFVWDDRLTYNLANGRIADSGATGAPTALLFRAIGNALERGTGFDFEGSMLRPVERFVRGFGGTPVPYSVVRRSSPAWERSVARRRLAKRLLRR